MLLYCDETYKYWNISISVIIIAHSRIARCYTRKYSRRLLNWLLSHIHSSSQDFSDRSHDSTANCESVTTLIEYRYFQGNYDCGCLRWTTATLVDAVKELNRELANLCMWNMESFLALHTHTHSSAYSPIYVAVAEK